ncbi:MAG TPA: CapA family protein [Acidiferrobacterales bacterium]|nr:CapA family protein [Acidiferrobacterales bacterium]
MDPTPKSADTVTMFLCGDVMTGRGIDQILPHPNRPELHEGYMASALDYLQLAEQASGPIAHPVDFTYIWGDALAELERVAPAVRIINLETSVTRSESWQPKNINYRMHPDNIPCITAAGIDCCVLANNHVLDFGEDGLEETLDTLKRAGLHVAGAGRNRDEARAPAVLALPGGGRVLVFAFGVETSGISRDWAATAKMSGINRLDDLSERTVQQIAAHIESVRRPGDIVVASIHWGANFEYAIPPEQQRFARALIDEAGVAVVHGHSSHHAKGIEVYRERPIFYGCGDLLNDYEGISGYEAYRGDLGLMYFVTVERATGRLVRLDMTPTRIHRFQVRRAEADEAQWLWQVLKRESAPFGVDVVQRDDYTLQLRWGGTVSQKN